MTPFPHRYGVDLMGGPHGHAALSGAGTPPLSTAPPPEFGGPGDAWSPEQLLLAAVDACFLFTFRVVARASGLDFVDLDVSSEGIVDRANGVTRFTQIVLWPRLTVAPGADPDRAIRVMEKAERACLVTASLSTPVRLEPRVDVAGPVAAATDPHVPA